MPRQYPLIVVETPLAYSLGTIVLAYVPFTNRFNYVLIILSAMFATALSSAPHSSRKRGQNQILQPKTGICSA